VPWRPLGWLSAALAVLPQSAGELVVGAVGGHPESGGELLAVLLGQQAVQRGEEDRAVREPQRAGDEGGARGRRRPRRTSRRSRR
jgi:hypothetical protein